MVTLSQQTYDSMFGADPMNPFGYVPPATTGGNWSAPSAPPTYDNPFGAQAPYTTGQQYTAPTYTAPAAYPQPSFTPAPQYQAPTFAPSPVVQPFTPTFQQPTFAQPAPIQGPVNPYNYEQYSAPIGPQQPTYQTPAYQGPANPYLGHMQYEQPIGPGLAQPQPYSLDTTFSVPQGGFGAVQELESRGGGGFLGGLQNAVQPFTDVAQGFGRQAATYSNALLDIAQAPGDIFNAIRDTDFQGLNFQPGPEKNTQMVRSELPAVLGDTASAAWTASTTPILPPEVTDQLPNPWYFPLGDVARDLSTGLGVSSVAFMGPGTGIKPFARELGSEFGSMVAGRAFQEFAPESAQPFAPLAYMAGGVPGALLPDVVPPVARGVGRGVEQAAETTARAADDFGVVPQGGVPGGGMVFRTGRIPASATDLPEGVLPSTQRRVIPDSTSGDALKEYLSGITPEALGDEVAAGRQAVMDAIKRAADAKRVDSFRVVGDGAYVEWSGIGRGGGRVSDGMVRIDTLRVAPQPHARLRLWFHSTNDLTYDLPDPDMAVGQATAITQGPGIYLAADPAKSAGRYGNRTFVTEFDGNVLDLTAPGDAAVWARVREGLASRIEADNPYSPAIERLRRGTVEPDAEAVRAARQSAELANDVNGYAYREKLLRDLFGNAYKVEVPPEWLGRFSGALGRSNHPLTGANTRTVGLSMINDSLADSGVDALFHHSPRADGDVLIVLNGESARVVAEARNAGDALKSGTTLAGILNDGRGLSLRDARWRHPSDDLWQLEANGGVPTFVVKAGDAYEVGGAPGRFASLEEAKRAAEKFARRQSDVAVTPTGRAPEYRQPRPRLSAEGIGTNATQATEDFAGGLFTPIRNRLGIQEPDVPPSQRGRVIPGEKGSTAALRQYDGRVRTQKLEALDELAEGNAKLRDLKIGTRVGPQTIVRRDPDMEQLFRALHGEGAPPPRLQAIYDDIKARVDEETARSVGFDPNFMARDDYFPRFWKAPKETRAGAGKIGAKPGFQKPRADATFSEMLAEGWEPRTWNPYEMMAIRRDAGIEFREQMTLVRELKDLGVAVPVDGPLPDGWRVPKVGPAFEGKPRAFIPDEAGPNGESIARVTYTDRLAVPANVADTLESIYGTPVSWGHLGRFDIQKAITKSMNLFKRTKLFGSLFQQVDFATRASSANVAGAIDALLAGKPISAIKNTFAIPMTPAKLLRANLSPNYRATLRKRILSTDPLFDGRNVSFRSISEAGWSTQDVSILGRGAKGMLDEAIGGEGKRLPALVAARLRNVDQAMQRGLFDGVYPEAQMQAIRNFIGPRIIRQHPNWTDAQISGEIASQVNKMFSTLPDWQTLLKAPGMKSVMKNVFFSTNETESLLRQGLSAIPGTPGDSGLWRTYFAGGLIFLAAVANAIHYATTGEWLPLDRYTPVKKDPFSPFGWGYNTEFMAPEIPIKGRNDTKLTIDLMGQMDTIFRVLDPLQFVENRLNVLPRTLINQKQGKDFFGEPYDGPLDRFREALKDLGLPIGLGNLVGESEERLGDSANAIQASGLNIRAESTPNMRDRYAQEQYGRPWDALEPFEQAEVLKANPQLAAELGQRTGESAARQDPFAINRVAADKVKEEYATAQASLDEQFSTGAIDGSAYRSMRSALRTARANRIKGIYETSPEFEREETGLTRWFDVIEQNTRQDKSVDWDAVEEWEAAHPEDMAYVNRNLGLDDTPVERQLRVARQGLESSGFFDLYDAAFEQFKAQRRAAGDNRWEQYATYDDWREASIRWTIENEFEPGTDPAYARVEAERALTSGGVYKAISEIKNGDLETQWINEARKTNPDVFMDAIRWGYWVPTKAQREYLKAQGYIP